jgi:transglutaminase-like putative cysteine protease
MMTSPSLQTRAWVVASAGIAQVAAVRAGMLPWWALPVTIVMTLAIARQTGPVDAQRAKLAQGTAVVAVAAFTLYIAAKAIAAGRDEADPLNTMRLLTEALVVLSLVMAPTWRSARDYRVWLSITTGVLVAAAFGAHTVITDVLLVAAWILVLMAMTNVQRAAMAEAVAPATSVPTLSSTSPGALAVASPVIASLTAGVLVFLALPAGLGGGGLAAHLVHPANNAANLKTPSRSAVGVDTNGDGDLDLLVRGTLPDTPLLRVPANSPPLWRGSIYTTYTGDSWLADPNQRFTFTRGADPTVPPSASDPPAVGATHVYNAEFLLGVNGSLMWAPGVPLRVHGDGGSIQGVARNPGNVRLVRLQPISGYTVTTAVATTSPARLIAATGSDRVGPEWTELPTELPTDVSQLAHQITAGATSRYQQVTELEAYLRSHETYSLNSPVPANGQDAVADFLFRDHIGFCEQFASAEAVMLRTLGVPARVVSGLAYGTRQGQTRLITEADAHAWVEVYYPGIGWSPTDPTAGVNLAAATSAASSPIAALLHHIANDMPGGRIGVIALLIALILTAMSVLRIVLARSGGSRGPSSAPATIGPVLTAFNRFARRRQRRLARAPAETAREYIRRVGGPGSLDTAVFTLEQECYGLTPPDPADTVNAVAAFATGRSGQTDDTRPRICT